jgi:hypothetical protein
MTEPRNADNWAKPIDTFHVDETVQGAYKGNVEGRKPTGPLQGFGSSGRRPTRCPFRDRLPKSLSRHGRTTSESSGTRRTSSMPRRPGSLRGRSP